MWNEILNFIKDYQTILGFMLTWICYYFFQLRYARLLNLSSIVPIEMSLGYMERNGFIFHGIKDEEMMAINITRAELAYLVANFTAGRIYDVSTYLCPWGTFPEDNYRYKMLAQKKTRDAWGLILKMMTEDGYVRKLNRTKHKIQKELE